MESKRNNEQDVSEKMFMKLVNTFFPNIFKLLPNWVEQFENMDYSQPKTLMRNIEKDIEATVKPITIFKYKLFLRFIRQFVLKSSFVKKEFIQIPNKMAKLTKSMAKEDSRYSLLLKLVSEADNNHPFSPFFVVNRHGDPQRTFPIHCSPMPYLLEAEKTEGEKRADQVYEAMRRICEHIYQPYIKTLWQLSYLRLKEIPPVEEKRPSFGGMINR